MSLPVVDRCPTSFGQQRLWFLAQYESLPGLYNIPAAWRLEGPLHLAALEWSLNEVIRRHEILRTTFEMEGDALLQVIAPDLPLRIEVVDLSGNADAEAHASSVLARAFATEFDLSRGPLLRMDVIRLGPVEHLLALTLHHIVSDGWSLSILMRELGELYATRCARQPSPLEELPIQYGDFAVWQREWLQGEVMNRQLAYWRRVLADAPGVLDLPTDHPRPAVPSHTGASVDFTFSRSPTARLLRLAESTRTTLFIVTLCAFNVLLHRYCRQNDLCVGYPVANRRRQELEALIGFFVNTLVLRTRVDPRQSFRALLQQTRNAVLDADANQDVPFEVLVRELHAERSTSHSPLFQAMFAFYASKEDVGRFCWNVPGLQASPIPFPARAAKFDLTANLHAHDGELFGKFEYATELFDRATIERMVAHYRVLLEGVAENPDAEVRNLPLLTAAERQQIVFEWNETESHFPDRCVHELFEEHAATTPHAIAIVFEDRSYSYAELNARANRLANYLRELGVGAESLVGFSIERGVEMVIGVLGILKAGGAYVPLDPDQPRQRIEFMLRDVQPVVLIAQSHLLSRLPTGETPVVLIDAHGEDIARRSSANPASVARPGHRAYCLYTSGSTGEPKAVEIEHRSVVRLVRNTQYARLTDDEVFLHAAPVHFDASTFEIWGSLLNGARLAIMPPGRISFTVLADIIVKHGVTTLWLTSALFEYFCRDHIEALRGVRQLMAGGDVLPVPTIVKVLRELPDCSLINGYGPTETTTFAACYRFPRTFCGTRAPVGRPIANTRIHILDDFLNPVPIGVTGEIHIAGPGLARGYLNRPGLTAAKFIPDPFGKPGERLYKSGDYGRYLPDGTIDFLGRRDDQVKIRGFRVETGEIESALFRHEAVDACAVLAREDAPGDKRLVAYVVPRKSAEPTADELAAFLRGALPEYMIPAFWMFLENLPVTANGKVERRALPAPDTAASGSPQQPRSDEQACSPTEKLVVAIWADLLGLPSVDVHDDFFRLGGHSLLAAVAAARMREQVGLEVSVTDIFMMRTVRQTVEFAASHKMWSPLVPFHKTGERAPIFFVHPARGSVALYETLASSFAGRRPFYGIQAYGLQPGQRALDDIEKIALTYADAVIEECPRGSILVGGWSFGAHIAHELAWLCEQRGRHVSAVVMIDSVAPMPEAAPAGPRPAVNRTGFLQDTAFLAWFSLVFDPGNKPIMSVAELDGVPESERVRHVLQRAEAWNASVKHWREVDLVNMIDLYFAAKVAVASFRPHTIQSDIVLIRPKVGSGSPSCGWERYTTGTLITREWGEDHFSMMNETGQRAIGGMLNDLLTA